MFKNYLDRIIKAIDKDVLFAIDNDVLDDFYNDKITYKELYLIRDLIEYAIQLK